MKQIIVCFDFQDVTAQQYDNIWGDLRASGQAHPKGLMSHIAGPKPNNGFKVVDVWESQEAFEAFGATLMPLMAKHAIPATQPEIIPVHWIYEPQLEIA